MLYFANKLLKENEKNDLRKRLLSCSDWQDGSYTARGSAKIIKRNLQLTHGETYDKSSEEIIKYIKENNVIDKFAFPSKIFNILFSRTGVGMFYGPHFDQACGENQRRDLSFTIFLNDKNEYKGGELILYIPPETRSIKLNAGDIVIYPTKYLHEVKTVTEGERMVCVGWIESQIPRDDDRDMLGMLLRSIIELQIDQNENSISKNNLYVAINNLRKRFSNLS